MGYGAEPRNQKDRAKAVGHSCTPIVKLPFMEPCTLTLDLRSYSSEVESHQHDYHQLVLPVAGRMDMSVGSREGGAGIEQIAVIPAGEEHGFAAAGDNAFVVADVPVALAPELARLPAFIQLDPVLSQYVSFLHQHLLQDGKRSSERQMLLLLIQLLHERFGDSVQLDRRIKIAKTYLEEHFHEAVSLSRLAAVANLSERQLSELFRRQLGMTPRQYLTEKRMQQAWTLLEAGELSVQQVADKVGYTSLAAFSDRFRKHFGRSPRYFRQIGK